MHRSAARAVMSSASSTRTAGSASRPVWARRTSVFPRMSAVFQADLFAPRIETTSSAAASRSIHPGRVPASGTGSVGSR